MQFGISVNMERTEPSQSVREVERNALELVTIAEQGGFDAACSAAAPSPTSSPAWRASRRPRAAHTCRRWCHW